MEELVFIRSEMEDLEVQSLWDAALHPPIPGRGGFESFFFYFELFKLAVLVSSWQSIRALFLFHDFACISLLQEAQGSDLQYSEESSQALREQVFRCAVLVCRALVCSAALLGCGINIISGEAILFGD